MLLRNTKVINDPYTFKSSATSPGETMEQNKSTPPSRSSSPTQGLTAAMGDAGIAAEPAAIESEEEKMRRMMNVLQTIAINDANFTPAHFQGNEKDSEKTEKWLDYFHNYTAFRGIDEEAQLRLFKLLLTGQANEWVKSLPSTVSGNLKSLTAEFRQRFSMTDITRWRKATAMWTREQGHSESVDSYITDIVNMARVVPIVDKELIRFAIIKGLRDNIKIHVLQSEATTIEAVTRSARIAEAAQSAAVSTSNDVSALSAQMAEMLKMMKSSGSTSIAAVDEKQRQRSPSPAPRRVQFDDRPSFERRPQPEWSRRDNQQLNQERTPQRMDSRTSRWTERRTDATTARGPQRGDSHYGSSYNQYSSVCDRCGLSHTQGGCPAFNRCCYHCGQPNHFARACRVKFHPATQSNSYNQF
jgi:hypothetical protein